MNENDLKVALSFLDETTKESVILQCYSVDEIPLVKRLMRHVMGDPSAMLDFNVWRYGCKTFRIIPVSRGENAIRGQPRNRIFYISYADERDWNELMKDKE